MIGTLISITCVLVITVVCLCLELMHAKRNAKYWEERTSLMQTRLTTAHEVQDELQRKLDDELRVHQIDIADHKRLEDAVREKLLNPRVAWSKVADQFQRLLVHDES
jgi:signal transduction histidine kinase